MAAAPVGGGGGGADEKHKDATTEDGEPDAPMLSLDGVFEKMTHVNEHHVRFTFDDITELERSWMHETTKKLILKGYTPRAIVCDVDDAWKTLTKSTFQYDPPDALIGIWTTFSFVTTERPNTPLLLSENFPFIEEDKEELNLGYDR